MSKVDIKKIEYKFYVKYGRMYTFILNNESNT